MGLNTSGHLRPNYWKHNHDSAVYSRVFIILLLALCFSCDSTSKQLATGGSSEVNTGIEKKLVGDWLNSHEENSGKQMIFRPSTYPFLPSRGRYGYQIEKGGGLKVIRPGPTDKREITDGTWSIEEDSILMLRPAGGASLRFRIISVDAERLVLAPL